jgi:hypothetical protein
MIHHTSFGVTDPERVARVLASLVGAVALRAPSPPFPSSAWFVVAGDDRGSMLEILPATVVYDPDARLGLAERPASVAPNSSHVLIGAQKSREDIKTAAEREGWHVESVETGLFSFTKIWIDGSVLVQVIAQDEVDRYLAAFGGAGIATLDAKLRDLEATLTKALA